MSTVGTGNYSVFKGIVSFKKTGDGSYRDLGNCPTVTLTANVTKKDHFSARGGVNRKDFSHVDTQSMAMKISCEEMMIENLALWLMGDIGSDTAGNPQVSIFSQSQITGALKFVGTNDIGRQFDFDLPNVNITPSGDLAMISTDVASFDLAVDVLDPFGTMTDITPSA